MKMDSDFPLFFFRKKLMDCTLSRISGCLVVKNSTAWSRWLQYPSILMPWRKASGSATLRSSWLVRQIFLIDRTSRCRQIINSNSSGSCSRVLSLDVCVGEGGGFAMVLETISILWIGRGRDKLGRNQMLVGHGEL